MEAEIMACDYRAGWMYGERGVWTYGERKGELSRYLTILGSAYRAPTFYATRAEAEAALDVSGLRDNPHMNMCVAHVTEVPHGGVTGRGYAYPISGAFDSETEA
jgi:hypothetical protein